MTDTAGRFVQEFNQRLGQYTRNPAVRTPEQAMVLNLSARLLNDRQREKAAQEMERQDHAAKLLDARRREMQSGNQGFGATSGEEPKFGALSQDTADLLTDKRNTGFMAKIDIPSWVPGNDTISDVLRPTIGAAKTPTLWLLDKISRPSYALNNTLKEALEDINAGDPGIEKFGEAAKGAPGAFWKGLSGEEKPGYGDVIEQLASMDQAPGIPFSGLNDIRAVSQGTRFEKPTELYVDNAKRGAGFGGEIAADPTNIVGGKIFTAVGDSVRSGTNADDAYKALVGKTVDDAIDSRGLTKPFNVKRATSRPNPNGPGKISPTLPVGRTALHDAAQRGLENSTIRIGGGAAAGRTIGAQTGAYVIADNVSNEMRTFMFKNLDNIHKTFDDILSSSKTLTKAEIAKLRKDKYVAEYLDELVRLTRRANPAQTIADVEKVLLHYAPKTKDDILRMSSQAAEHAKSQLDNTIAGVRKEIFEKLNKQVQNIPGIHIGSREIPFTRLGKAYHAAKYKWGSPLEGIQFSEQFPSVTPQIAQAVKSTGQEAYEAFHASVQDIVKSLKLTKEERKGFNQRILTNTNAPTARLQAAQDFLKRAYREMWQDEVEAGIRSADDIMPSNYVYNYYKPKLVKGYMEDIKNYKSAVKNSVSGSKSLSANHIRAAQAQGLKVEQDAFRSLLYRKLKSNRKLTQAWFKGSLLDNYGIKANKMSKTLQLKNRLTKVSSKLETRLQKELGPGDDWYLPNDIANVFDKYIGLTGANATKEMGAFITMVDTVTRWFKQAATIYYPGFHIRNSMGDMFMSFIDGVRASDYVNLRRLINKVRGNPNATEKIGGIDFAWADLKKIFEENVSTGGFKRSDFDTPAITTKAEAAQKFDPRRGSNLIREQSERREDFFRFTHFLHAFKEELPTALKRTGSQEAAIQAATRASAYRVNKYLFDYGASTLFEKKYLKRLFPFYTYTRKAMPALAEGMFLHPSQFAKTNRFFLDDDNGDYADMLTPEYQREIGYRKLAGGENPWLLGGQFLPTDVLNRNTNVLNVPDWARNVMAQTNPFAKALPEMAADQKFFNQKPIQGPTDYFTDSFLPFVHPAEDLINAGKSMPGIPGSGDKRKLLSGRFGLGLPITQITNNQQTAALYGLKDKYENELGKLNPGLEANGYRIYGSYRKDGASFRIRNESTGDIVMDTKDVEKIIARAKELSK